MTGFLLVLLLLGAGVAAVTGTRRVPDQKVGIVHRRIGRQPGDSCRVRTDGAIGPQAEVLRPNTWKWRVPLVDEIVLVGQVEVPDGTIGLVVARDGRVRTPGRRLGRYVECDYFQDGAAFLDGGGEQGRQVGFLPGGARYTINTELFEVLTTRSPQTLLATHGLTPADLTEIEVVKGHTGVVIALDGEPAGRDEAGRTVAGHRSFRAPDGEQVGRDQLGRMVAGHRNFRLPWVFLEGGGQMGVQEETLPGGSAYTINPWFAEVVLIPDRTLRLEWKKRSEKPSSNFDAELDELTVNIQGYRLTLELSQVVSIPATAAPLLVQQFGVDEKNDGDHTRPAPVQRFVAQILGATVESYFRGIIGRLQLMDFITDFDRIGLELQDCVRAALEEWGVETGVTAMTRWDSDDPEVDRIRQGLAKMDVERRELEREVEMGRLRRDAERLRYDIERMRIDLRGESDVIRLRKEVELLGSNALMMERLAAQLKEFAVPTYFNAGGGDLAEQMLSTMPFAQAQSLIMSVLQDAGRERLGPAHGRTEAVAGQPDGASAAGFGDGASAAGFGDGASAAESGDRASAAGFGDRASAAGFGDGASAAESGDRASAAGFGDRAPGGWKGRGEPSAGGGAGRNGATAGDGEEGGSGGR